MQRLPQRSWFPHATAARRAGLRVAIVTIALIGAIYGVAHLFIDGSFASLEQKEIRRSVDLVLRTLEADNGQIEVVSRDYARWDDMYRFVSDLDQRFIDENFSKAGLAEMGIDIAAVFDASGDLVFAVEYNAADDSYALPAPVPTQRELELAREQLESTSDAVGGVRYTWLAGRPFVVAVHQITHSDRSGPTAGSLVLARALEIDDIERLSTTSKLPVSIVPLTSGAAATSLPTVVRDWLAEPSRRPGDWMPHPTGDDSIEGYGLVADLAGQPALVIGTRIARDVLSYGKRTRATVVAAVTLLIALCALLVYSLLVRAAAAAAASRANEARYRAVVSNAEEAIVVFDHVTRAVLEANAALVRLAQRPLDRLVGITVDELFDRRQPEAGFEAVRQAALERRVPQEARLLRPDGSSIDVELSVSLLSSELATLNCLIVRDISERKRTEAQLREHHRSLEHLAHHDALTGMPNRLFLSSRLPQMLEDVRREGGSLAMLYLDFDNFKRVNDLAGHHVGDQMLQAVATQLRQQVDPGDIVIRMGGDEFVIVSRHADLMAPFEPLAKRVVDALQHPVRVGDRAVPATASVGVCVFPHDAQDLVGLLQCADLALYAAKRQGRNRFQFFELAMVEQTRARVALEQELRSALEAGEIDVHMQPIVELATRRIVGFEALARWTHARHGEIPPSRFVPVAEESGLIADLGAHVLGLAGKHLADWRALGLDVVPVHVNVSARQFERSRLAEQILEVTRAHGLEPELLHVELTESTVMSGNRTNLEALHQLREVGIRISVDDFGTGYSSLSYLKHLPIDYLKIDRSFVRDMIRDANDEAIVAAITSMAQRLRIHVVAEGVESAEQADRLLALGCQFGQGYHFGRPLPADQCVELLRDGVRRERSGETLRLRVIDGSATTQPRR